MPFIRPACVQGVRQISTQPSPDASGYLKGEPPLALLNGERFLLQEVRR